MSPGLPDNVDPWRMADLGKIFSGCVPICELPRIAKAVLESDGSVDYELAFDRDERGRARIQGFVRATLKLECQRCVGPMYFPVDARLNLAPVAGEEEAARLSSTYDPLLIEENRVQLLDIVEDELLLALPQVPMHPLDECASQPFETASEPASAEQDETTKKASPFAVLAEIKQKQS